MSRVHQYVAPIGSQCLVSFLLIARRVPWVGAEGRFWKDPRSVNGTIRHGFDRRFLTIRGQYQFELETSTDSSTSNVMMAMAPRLSRGGRTHRRRVEHACDKMRTDNVGCDINNSNVSHQPRVSTRRQACDNYAVLFRIPFASNDEGALLGRGCSVR